MKFLLLLFASVSLAAAKKPNIIVVLCDDLGYGDLECYGHPHIKTPHLNQLAKNGIRFTDFYSTAPVCSPSRVGLMTGRSPNRAGVYDWIPPNKPVHMRKSEITIPRLLKKAGYATAMSGKWHCNGAFNSPRQPQPDDAGFDHWFATQNNAAPSHENPRNFVRNGKPVGPLEGYSCQLVMDEAIDWMTGHHTQSPEQPFFMYVAFHEPHEPVASPKNLVADYKDAAENEDQAQYFANVTNLDSAVGKLMGSLKSLKIDENTLVVFTSDNGPETLLRYGKGSRRSYGSAAPLRGMKLWTTDAGFRVAGIMSWPAHIKGGQTVSHPVSALDFLPTFCSLAGTQAPAGLNLDGVNFLPALENKALDRKKPLLWVYYSALNKQQVAMRDGDWKVLAKLSLPVIKAIDQNNAAKVKNAQLSDIRIFKVTGDIREEKDLSSSHPDQLAELTKKLTREYQELVADSHVWDFSK